MGFSLSFLTDLCKNFPAEQHKGSSRETKDLYWLHSRGSYESEGAMAIGS
jgi:hypothetical protein